MMKMTSMMMVAALGWALIGGAGCSDNSNPRRITPDSAVNTQDSAVNTRDSVAPGGDSGLTTGDQGTQGEPSDDTYYLTDHSASIAEFGIQDAQTLNGWTIEASKSTRNDIQTHTITLTSDTAATRACTLRYKIPVSSTSLYWLSDDLKSRTAVEADTTYSNDIRQWRQDQLGPQMPVRPRQLWAGVENASTTYAVAADPYYPAAIQLEYSASEQALYLKYLLGFHSSKQTATIKFHSWQFSADRGARGIVHDLQNTICPEAFADRLSAESERHGSWLISDHTFVLPSTPSDFLFKIVQKGPNSASYAANGIWRVRYCYGYDTHITNLSGEEGYTAVMQGINTLAADGDIRALAVLNAGVHDTDSRYIYAASAGWVTNQPRFMPYPSPKVLPAPNHYYSEFGRHLDDSTYNGVMVDNNPFFYWQAAPSEQRTRINYRTDHFQYSEYPLSFDTEYRVGLHYETMAFEFLKGARTESIASDRFMPVMANGGTDHANFIFAHQDMLGGETSWQRTNNVWAPLDESAMLSRRIKAGRKPILMVQNPWRWDQWTNAMTVKYLARCASFGVLPSCFKDAEGGSSGEEYWTTSTYVERDRAAFRLYMPIIRELSEAGWQPVRNFSMSDSTIYGERFGDIAGSNKTVYITCFNPNTTSSKTFTLTSTAYSTGVAEFKEMLSNTSKSWTGNTLSVTLGPEAASVFKITLN